MTKGWSREVTHLIPATKCGANCSTALSAGRTSTAGRHCGRTIKFCSAVLAGQWIVGAGWLEASSRLGAWADETEHEIEGDQQSIDEATGRGAGGPRIGRLRAAAAAPRLFEGLRFFLPGGFTKPSKVEVGRLLQLGGGQCLERWPEEAEKEKGMAKGTIHEKKRREESPPFLVLSAHSPAPRSLAELCMARGLPPPIDLIWVMNSISRHKLEAK